MKKEILKAFSQCLGKQAEFKRLITEVIDKMTAYVKTLKESGGKEDRQAEREISDLLEEAVAWGKDAAKVEEWIFEILKGEE